MTPVAASTTLSFAGLLLIGAGIGSVTKSANAGVRSTYTNTSVQIRSWDQNIDEDSAPAGVIQSESLTPAGSTFGYARAFAGYKRCGAFANGEKHGDRTANILTLAVGRTGETLTFFSPSLQPIEGVTIHARVFVQGSLAGSSGCPIGDGYFESNGSFSFYLGPDGQGFNINGTSGWLDNDPDFPDFGFQNGILIIDLPWENGASHLLRMSAVASADMGAARSCAVQGQADTLNMFEWIGVASVTDSGNNPITDYTFTDEAGRDWRTPAPVADINYDGLINIDDLVAVIISWGACGSMCPADVNDTGTVDIDDLVLVITSWGN